MRASSCSSVVLIKQQQLNMIPYRTLSAPAGGGGGEGLPQPFPEWPYIKHGAPDSLCPWSRRGVNPKSTALLNALLHLLHPLNSSTTQRPMDV